MVTNGKDFIYNPKYIYNNPDINKISGINQVII